MSAAPPPWSRRTPTAPPASSSATACATLSTCAASRRTWHLSPCAATATPFSTATVPTGALLAAARRAGADIALFGHTHIPHEEYDPESGIYLFNPGSIGEPRAGRPSYGILSLSGKNVLFSLGETE